MTTVSPSPTPPSAERLQAMLADVPFERSLGLEVESLDAASRTLVLRCRFSPTLARDRDGERFHGGVLASVIDVAGDFALIALLGHAVPTANLRVDFLKSAPGPSVTAHAVVRRLGRTLAVVDVDVCDAAGALVAIGRGCYAVREG